MKKEDQDYLSTRLQTLLVPASKKINDFLVYDGSRCTVPNHSVVLVGHGREDGVEFWLLRNSMGADWGEGGYFKLAKSASRKCLVTEVGFAYGTRDGKHFVKPKKNDLNRDALFKKFILHQ